MTAVLDQLVSESPWLGSRRFETFSLTGENTIFTGIQGRGWGNQSSLSIAGIEDLITSIASVGLLQPLVLEELPGGRLNLINGERRLRALRWGSVNQPENPHFGSAEAIVVVGPLSVDDKRRWQLIENVAREDYKEGELAAALLYERASRLAEKLTAHGIDLGGVLDLDDPIEQWNGLNRLRVANGLHSVGVGWEEAISRLGLSLSESRAAKTVAAFRSLPPELSSEMDANDVALASRREFVKLARGRKEAAQGIWEALRERGQTHLLTRSCQEAVTHPDADIDEVIELAAQVHDTTPADTTSAGGQVQAAPLVCDELAESAIEAMNTLVAALRAGATMSRYRAGTMVLHCRQVLAHLGDTAGGGR